MEQLAKRQSSEKIWRERLRRFERSGKSIKDFCVAEGCSDKSFYTWRRRLQESRGEIEFVEVHNGEPDPIELVLARGDIIIRVGKTFDENALRRLIQLIRGACA